MNEGGSGSRKTKTFNVKLYPLPTDDKDLKIDNPSPPSDSNPSIGVATLVGANGGILVKIDQQASDFEMKWSPLMKELRAEINMHKELQMIHQGQLKKEEAKIFGWNFTLEKTTNNMSLHKSLSQPVVCMNRNQD
ncbi:hypothetical protein F0562_001089 [Nyssa sinensis]|uniref:Uncharacterized protein n=1 Tax=Nyssa sinensis TaxID=561372 RepID=A0A5J5C2B8_9ASTE|nr:hypothetical protein F0562_001089 [Nyssa sinensis]